MIERELVRVLCATCKGGKRPTIATVTMKDSELRYRAKFKAKVVNVMFDEGSESCEPGWTSHVAQSVDIGLPITLDATVDQRLRCGCPNGHGVVTLEEAWLLDAVERSRSEGRVELIFINITPNAMRYHIGP